KSACESLGHIYFLTGQFQKGAEYYDKALKIARGFKNPEQEAVALRNLAAVYIAWADYDKAESLNQEALKTFADRVSTRGTQMTLNNTAVMEKNRGRFYLAAEGYVRAIDADKEANVIQLKALNNLGSLFAARGEPMKALESFQNSLDLAKKMGDSKAEGETLMNIVKVQVETGDLGAAQENGKKALEAFYKVGAPTDWAKKVVGDICLDLGKTQEAESYIKEADYDSSLGRLYLTKGDLESAKKHYEQLMKAAEKAGNLDELFTAYTGLGKVYEAKKNYTQAYQNYSKGSDLTEDMRSNLLLSERQNFFSGKINGFTRAEPAKGLVRVSLKQDRASQSIYPSELTRARDFADTLAQRIKGDYFGVPEDVLKDEMLVTDKLASIKMGMDAIPKDIDKERVNDIKNRIKTAETEKTAFLRKLREKYKDYAAVKYPAPVKLEATALKPSEYVLFFDVTSEGVGARLIKGKKVVSSEFIEIKQDDLDRDVKKFRQCFEQARLKDFDAQLSSKLYSKLLKDSLTEAPEGIPVTIIPDGSLALLPFEALVIDGTPKWKQGEWGDYPDGLRYVGDRNPVVYAQSLTALTLARGMGEKAKTSASAKSGNTDRMLVMADPVFDMNDTRAQGMNPATPVAASVSNQYTQLMAAIEGDVRGIKLPRLQGTEELAGSLEKLYGKNCDSYTGLKATKSMFMERVSDPNNKYNSLVLATHGLISNDAPWLLEPVLALTMVPPGADGFLTMTDVAGLKLDSNIAALTACQTGVGVSLAGEGVMSMGRAFQIAGAKMVLMSLWSVAEQSSVMLMDQFFKNINEGKDKLRSWQEAKTHIRKAGFEHPFFWAAFIMSGDPGI
ncbi:MAG: CHAT domain-containing protein, partial [Deltaproteobacteria bacterium]|nr:CHAT domain-containing protein [Deltaproteobacteria bacterium]